MADAWGGAWGSAWGVSWGSTAAAVAAATGGWDYPSFEKYLRAKYPERKPEEGPRQPELVEFVEEEIEPFLPVAAELPPFFEIPLNIAPVLQPLPGSTIMPLPPRPYQDSEDEELLLLM